VWRRSRVGLPDSARGPQGRFAIAPRACGVRAPEAREDVREIDWSDALARVDVASVASAESSQPDASASAR